MTRSQIENVLHESFLRSATDATMTATIGESRLDVGLMDCRFTLAKVTANQNHLIGVFDLLMIIRA